MTETKMLTLKQIGVYKAPSGSRNLRDYYVDDKGSLYSRNMDSYELGRREGYGILKCSDDSVIKGDIVNSLRDTMGTKVTIRRKNILWSKVLGEITTFRVKTSENDRRYQIIGEI